MPYQYYQLLIFSPVTSEPNNIRQVLRHHCNIFDSMNQTSRGFTILGQIQGLTWPVLQFSGLNSGQCTEPERSGMVKNDGYQILPPALF